MASSIALARGRLTAEQCCHRRWLNVGGRIIAGLLEETIQFRILQ